MVAECTKFGNLWGTNITPQIAIIYSDSKMVMDFCGARCAPRAGAIRQDRCFSFNHFRFARVFQHRSVVRLLHVGLHSRIPLRGDKLFGAFELR